MGKSMKLTLTTTILSGIALVLLFAFKIEVKKRPVTAAITATAQR